MKKILSFMLICFYANTASAQVLIALLLGDKLSSDKIEFGLNLSPTLSGLSEMDGDAKYGLGLGLYFNFKLSPNLYFRPEFSPKSVFGARHLEPYPTGNADIDQIYLTGDDAEVVRKLKAISLPLMMRYRIKGLLFAQLGPQVNFFTRRSKDVFNAKVDENKIDYKVGLKDQLSFMDLGLTGGLEYKIKKEKGMGIGLRYYYGFTDVITKMAGSQRNSAFYLTVSVPIDPGAKTK